MGDPLTAHDLDDNCERGDAFAQPIEFLFGDAIMFGVSSLDVGFLQFFEARPIRLGFSWPGVNQPGVDTFGLRPQEGQIMDVRCVESADK